MAMQRYLLRLLPRAAVRHVRNITNRSRIGTRDVVGYGYNGGYNYKDDPHFPFPAIRFKENTKDVVALRQKETGDWKCLCQEEKKALYRASFCQTFSEFQHPTQHWKIVIGTGLFLASWGFWHQIIYRKFIANPEWPPSYSLESRMAQFRRMLDLHVAPIDGLSSQWDYDNDCWKWDNFASVKGFRALYGEEELLYEDERYTALQRIVKVSGVVTRIVEISCMFGVPYGLL